MTENDDSSRRRFLRLAGTGSAVALAGCLEGIPGLAGTADETAHEEERGENWCREELSGPVPERLKTAESLDGLQRDPSDLTSKEDAVYTCHKEGLAMCANCRFFVPNDVEGKPGACTAVEGYVRSTDWCALYQPEERVADESLQPSDRFGN